MPGSQTGDGSCWPMACACHRVNHSPDSRSPVKLDLVTPWSAPGLYTVCIAAAGSSTRASSTTPSTQ